MRRPIDPRLTFAAITLGTLIASAICCSSSPDYYRGPQSPCSSGTPYAFNTELQPIPADMPGGPRCILRCGETDMGMNTTIDQLPSGSCRYDDEVCQAGAYRKRSCSSGTFVQCSFTSYSCRCEGAEWRCYRGNPGASICTCPDAGVPDTGLQDAAADG